MGPAKTGYYVVYDTVNDTVKKVQNKDK